MKTIIMDWGKKGGLLQTYKECYGTKKETTILAWGVGESFSEITLGLALKSQWDLNQTKKEKNISGNGKDPRPCRAECTHIGACPS